MIVALHDTKYFSRVKIPFSEMSVIGDEAANSRLPIVGFRREPGFFYPFLELQETLVPHLDPKPTLLQESDLIVWTQKEKDVPFGALSREYDGEKNRVPWWIIKPLARWQNSGLESSVIPPFGATFFIGAHVSERQVQPIGVSFRLDCGSLCSEWYLRPITVDKQARFPEGSVFLSVD